MSQEATPKLRAAAAAGHLRSRLTELAKRANRKLNPLDRREERDVVIDVLGICNLRCPSCPVGHLPKTNPAGLIDKKLFADLIAKADRDYKVIGVHLYNWAEPLLHPELPELVRIVARLGLKSYLSTNLNVLRDNVDDLLLAEPTGLRISLSGFTQPVYAKSHAGGNIERVKANMQKLAEARDRTKTRTRISVFFHKYKHNLHELAPMRQYAESLRFKWEEVWAYFAGIEKLMDFLDRGDDPSAEQDLNYALPVRRAIDATAPYRHEPCRLKKTQIVFDQQGNLMPCSAVYNYGKNSLGKYLDMTPADVNAAKQTASACDRCTAHGIHQYVVHYGHPELRGIYEQLVQENVAEQLVPLQPLRPAA